MRSKCAEKSPFSGLMSRALLDSVCVVVRESCLVSSPAHVSRNRSSLLSWPRCLNWHQNLGPLDLFSPPNISLGFVALLLFYRRHQGGRLRDAASLVLHWRTWAPSPSQGWSLLLWLAAVQQTNQQKIRRRCLSGRSEVLM